MPTNQRTGKMPVLRGFRRESGCSFAQEAAMGVTPSGDRRRLVTGGLEQVRQISLGRIAKMIALRFNWPQLNLTAVEWQTWVGGQPCGRVCRNLP